jgi:hypothetical protein
MNLRVLIYSNPLVVDKISKKFLFWKDSGFIFTKNLITSLPRDWRYYWLIPENITEDQKQWFLDSNDNISLIPYPYSTSIHQNRYNFYGNVLKKNFPYTKDVDIVLNNQPEVTANLKSFFDNQRRDNPPIFNFFHWIDCEESRKFAQELGGYFWREYDGVLNAERNYFHNEYAYSLFNYMVIKEIKTPYPFYHSFFNPPATNFGSSKIALPDKKIILFNHRLNNTTNYKFFIECIEKLHEIRDDFVVWFTDDSDKNKSRILEKPYIINRSLNPKEYGYLLSNSYFSVCVHKGYSTWNMAVIDAINANCFTIVPNTEKVYIDMFKYVDLTMYHDNTIEDVVSKMNNLLDTPSKELKTRAKEIKRIFPEYFSNLCFENIKDTIELSIDKRRIYKEIAKYTEVRDFIKENPGVTKETIVNNFWSFHVNSNFQKIRWKLMIEDNVIDDITQEITQYSIL